MSRARLTRDAALAELLRRGLGDHAAALARRVDLDVAKWGESERSASHRMHESRSFGLLVNSIAVADPERPDEDLVRLADAILTAADHAALRSGG